MKQILRWTLSIIWATLIWRLTTTPDFHVTDNNFLGVILSNGGHFFFFGMLAVLFKLDKLSTTYSVLLSSVYGLLIEFIQLNIPGRSFDLGDWALDTLGAIIFLAILNKYYLKSKTYKL